MFVSSVDMSVCLLVCVCVRVSMCTCLSIKSITFAVLPFEPRTSTAPGSSLRCTEQQTDTLSTSTLYKYTSPMVNGHIYDEAPTRAFK